MMTWWNGKLWGNHTEKSPFSKYLGLPNKLVIRYAKGPVEQLGSAKAPEELACDTAFLHILIVI